VLLPLFPLPNVVLFPSTRLPLHVFEPRYRKLVADLLLLPEHEREIGIVLSLPSDEGVDLVEPGCAGRLISHEPLADGRSNIVLEGLYRFTIEQEVEGEPYRRAEIQKLGEPLGGLDVDRVDELREEILSLISSLADVTAGGQIDLDSLRGLGRIDDLPTIVNRLAAGLDLPPLRKQSLLAEAPLARAAEMAGILRSRVRLLRSLAPFRHLAANSQLN